MLTNLMTFILKFFDGRKTLIGALQLAAPILVAKFPAYAEQIRPLADFVLQNLDAWTTSGTIILTIGLVCKFLKLVLAFFVKKFPDNSVLLTIEKLLAPNTTELRLEIGAA